jgi:glyoxylase-like metal-dependent hydrolase (beta-lactamase superfamily II)
MVESGRTSKAAALAASADMEPVQGAVEVDIPAPVLWELFNRADWWPRWNRCFFWARNRELKLGRQLVWCFEPIRRWYPYKMPAVARIVEVEPERKVTWEVTVNPGFYARHTYFMEDLGGGRTRFGSWEQAMGAQIRFPPTGKFWVAHFTFVKDRSLEGARELEEIYRREGRLTKDVLPAKRRWPFWAGLVLLLLLICAAAAAACFYVSYLRPSRAELAPGVHAVFAGGGNSLVVQDGADVLVVDPKFPPASGWLRKWVGGHVDAPVTHVVNTHYHYDHTEGNTDYPGARIFAQRAVPELMMKYDAEFWGKHRGGVPTNLVDDAGTVKVGGVEVALTYPGRAHTQGDLWVYLRKGGREIVVTGDLFMNGYYPFIDLDEGGTNVAGMIATLRTLAGRYPEATFLPGHGPAARSGDVLNYVSYLEALDRAVADARRRGLSEDEAAASIDLSRWRLSRLPSFHNGQLCWATAENNVRWVYQLQSGRIPKGHCTF